MFRKVRLQLAIGALAAMLLAFCAYPARASTAVATSMDRFVLHIPSDATVLPEVLDCMLSSMDECLAFAETSLGRRLRAPIHHLWVDEAPGVLLGLCVCKHGTERHEVVHILQKPPTSRNEVDNYASAWVHEYTHCVLYEAFGELPTLVNEGIACVVADDLLGRERHAQAAIVLAAGELPSLIALANWANQATRAWRFETGVNYSAAASFMSFIRDEYGRDALISMCERMPDCRVASWGHIPKMVTAALEETAGMSLDRLETAWRERLDSTEIDTRLKPRLVVSVRLLKHLHSSPDLDSLLFLPDLTGKNIDSFWNEFFRLHQTVVYFGMDRAGDTTEQELREQIDELHVKAAELRLTLLYGDGE